MNNYKLVKNTEWKDVEINGEVKEIPILWEVKKINQVAKIIAGQSPDMQNINEKDGVDFHQGNTLFSSKFIKSSIKKILKTKAKKLAPPNSILMSVRAPVGETNITNNEIAIGRGLAAVVPSIDQNYLLNILRLNKDNISGLGNGSTFEGMKISEFSDFEFAFSQQQSSIASVLSAQESIIQDIESLISKYESRFQYLSEELLSGRLRVKEVDGQITLYKNLEDNWKEVEVNGEMKEIPKDWQHSVVNKLFEIQRGKVLSKGYIQINAGNYPVYSSATENNGCIGRINSYMFDGEFLTWNTDGYAGSVFYRNGQFNCTNICGILKAKQPMNLHSFKFFLEPRFKKNVIHGGQLTNLKLMSSHVEGIELAYPQNSELELISLVFDKQEKLIEQQKELLAKEKQKFDWLLDNLLSGKYLIKEN